jgi:hypothetical protein
VLAHRSCLPEPAPTDEQAHATPAALVIPDQVRGVDGEGRMAVRKRERYAAVQTLIGAGHSLNSISRQMGLCFRTVQRYAQAGSLDELLATAERCSTLDRFKEYLLTRWNDGCTDTNRLHRELQGMGWRGSARTVQRYTRQLRGLTSTPPPRPVTPKPRKVARWLMTNPANLRAGDEVGPKRATPPARWRTRTALGNPEQASDAYGEAEAQDCRGRSPGAAGAPLLTI